MWPLIQYGLKPIFVDIDLSTLNINIEDLISKITKKTKAIMCVHILGLSSNMDKIRKICKTKKLILFEDTCESLGAKYNKINLGNHGDFGTYSFYYSHQITSGEGGMVVCKNKEDYNLLKCLRSHGWSRGTDFHKRFKKKYAKLAVIPTTAGSGAEVTSNAVIYIDGIKHSFESNLLIPDNFFLIPEFIVSAPGKIKASAGFDAIAQALESLVSKKSNDQSIDYATKSLKISINSYLPFLRDPNIKNAAEMSIAANLAGKAINISKTTAPHAVSYPFTSLFKISHGHAVGLFFEKFFKFNYDNLNKSDTSFDLKKRFDLIFNLFDVSDINNFNLKLSSIKKKANLEDDLNKLNINLNKNSENIINGINLLRLGNNPVKIDGKNIYNIISNID